MKKSSIESFVTKEDKLPITKIDAAVRQLETAIVLWFHDQDPVSVATLTHAGYQIVFDLNKRRAGPPMTMDGHRIRPEFRSDYIRLMRSAPNFFKHADEDPEAVHYFTPKVTPYLILEATDVYASWKLDTRPLFRLFSTWLLIEQPGIFTDEAKADLLKETVLHGTLLRAGKRKFFYDMLPVLSGIPSA